MAMLPGGPINSAETVRSMPQSTPLPVGVYSGIVTKVEQKPTGSNTGVMIEVEFDITAPMDYANRKFWDRFNVVNANADTVRIAKEALGDLAQACGVAELQDDEQLIGKEIMMELYVEKGKPYIDKRSGAEKMGNDQNRCGKYWPIGTDVESARKAHKERLKGSAAPVAQKAAGGSVASPAGNTPRWPTGGAPKAPARAAAAAPVPAQAAAPVQQQQAAAPATAAGPATNVAPWKRNKQ